ncbi:MAG: beta/gamma crystallin family protein [Vicinamibacteria bacterium]|nr:beta/gamma crystallin family protein [Vicinamibacteria bacterium]
MSEWSPTFAALLASVALTAQAGEITLYETADFGGRNVTLRAYTQNVGEVGFNDRTSSLVVQSGRWEVCADPGFGGYCTTLVQGEYRSLDGRLNNRISSAREVGSTPAEAGNYGNYGRGSIELFGRPDQAGRSIRIDKDMADLRGGGFNDRAASVVVHTGSWELCSDPAYGGTCRVYAPGRYDNLGYGMAKAISSARLVRSRRQAPFVHGGGWGGASARDARARVILYEGDRLGGRSMAISDSMYDLRRSGFSDRSRSVVVEGGTWLFCTEPDFRGQCRVMGPGQYPQLEPALQYSISSLRPTGPEAEEVNRPAAADGSLVLYADPGFAGKRLAVHNDVRDLGDRDFEHKAGSLTIWQGNWEACTEEDYGGRCAVFGPGRYSNLFGLKDRIASIHQVY